MAQPLTETVRNILTTEVKYVIAIVLFFSGFMTQYYGMRQDIALIKNDISNINANHEVHIQDLNQNIKDILEVVSEQQKDIASLQQQNAAMLQQINYLSR